MHRHAYDRPSAVSTFFLVSYLLTIYAWIVEIAVVLVHAFANKKLDPLGHAVLLAVSGSLTLFAVFRGKRDFRTLRWTGGRIPLTRSQSVIITLFVAALSCLATWVAVRLTEH